MPSDADRFWARVDCSDSAGCWPWTAARDSNGYGNLWWRGGYAKAHRVGLELALGRSLVAGMQACHRCDNPPCVRPDHLFEGSPLANQRDRIAKGRPGSPGPRNPSRGEGRWSAKLTAEQVASIRAIYAAGGTTQRDLAEMFGVQQGQISRIVTGARWRP